ncbi:MAG: twin-arginine translocase subunit TatC [Oscillospiraceae bacterium]|nr:twin-arginine translocase subunit TatC [Oscillospiraceae bacterium]
MNKLKEMSLFDHLDELRKRLIIIVIVNFVAAILLFSQTEIIMSYLLEVNPGMELVYTTPSELLTVYIQLSLILAVTICSPITVYQVWAFIEKGLYEKEKKAILFTLIFGVVFFIIGVAFCYFMVLPTTLEFFVRIAIEEVSSMLSIQSYVSFVNMMLLAFGLVFEMPVIIFLLSKLGIIKPAFLKKNRGIIIVAIFIFASIITPPDVISQLMLGIPMAILLEFSILICTLVYKGKKKEELESETE